MSQCKATTQDGSRCQNTASQGFGELKEYWDGEVQDGKVMEGKTAVDAQILSHPKYSVFKKIVGIDESIELFDSSFDSEKELVAYFYKQARPVFESIYKCSVNSVEKESWFRFRDAGYIDFRADLYIQCDETDYLIEAKNPTQDTRGLMIGLAQLMMYRIPINLFEKPTKFVLLTSTPHPMIFDFIREYDLDFDVMIINDGKLAHWENVIN